MQHFAPPIEGARTKHPAVRDIPATLARGHLHPYAWERLAGYYSPMGPSRGSLRKSQLMILSGTSLSQA